MSMFGVRYLPSCAILLVGILIVWGCNRGEKGATETGDTAPAGGDSMKPVEIDRSTPQALFAQMAKVMKNDPGNRVAFVQFATIADQREEFEEMVSRLSAPPNSAQERKLKRAFEKRNVSFEPIAKLIAMDWEERKKAIDVFVDPIPSMAAIWDCISQGREPEDPSLKPQFLPTIQDIKIEGDVATSLATVEAVEVKTTADRTTSQRKLKPKVRRVKETLPMVFKRIDGSWYLDAAATKAKIEETESKEIFRGTERKSPTAE